MKVEHLIICFILGFCIGSIMMYKFKDGVFSDQPIKLSYTLRCEDGKCDTTYKASTR